MAEEQLFELRNLVAVGSFQAAINEGLSLDKLPDAQRQERDVLVYRAYLGKGDHVTVLHEVKEGAPPALLAVRCLARYLGEEGQREAALAAIKQLQAEQPSQETVLLLAATMYLHEGNYDEAFRALHHSTSLECRALLVQAYLKIDRADLAQKELANLQQIDEDATLTQLATAWVDLTLGGEKLEEAFYIFNELIEKWNPTALLLNGVASTHLHRADNAEEAKKAEKLLLQALEKNPNDGETLVNLVCCYQHMGKSRDIINRYMSQIKTRAPRHAWVQEVDILEASFDRHAARFSASKSS